MNIHLHFHGNITLHNEDKIMADMRKINQAIDDLQGTVDNTQEQIGAILMLLKAHPTQQELEEIERRLRSVQSDLAGTSFETSGDETDGEGDEEGAGEPGEPNNELDPTKEGDGGTAS